MHSAAAQIIRAETSVRAVPGLLGSLRLHLITPASDLYHLTEAQLADPPPRWAASACEQSECTLDDTVDDPSRPSVT